MRVWSLYCFFFFFNDTATTEIYTLSLHDALPILAVLAPSVSPPRGSSSLAIPKSRSRTRPLFASTITLSGLMSRSEEHTSELQSLRHLVCRLLLEKKKQVSRKIIYALIDTLNPLS